MLFKTKPRILLAGTAWLLPLAVLVPYAFFAQRFRVLLWVIENIYAPFWIFLGVSLLISALACCLLYRVNKLGLYLFQFGAAIILVNGTYLAMSERRHGLLVILFVLSVLLVLVAEWMRRTLALPFYFSGRNWWESYPKALPTLKAYVRSAKAKDIRVPVRLTNLGQEGCFVFSCGGALEFAPNFLEIEGPNFQVSCSVSVEVNTRDRMGLGLRFVEDLRDGDWHKDLMDQLVLLRRAGYVSA